ATSTPPTFPSRRSSDLNIGNSYVLRFTFHVLRFPRPHPKNSATESPLPSRPLSACGWRGGHCPEATRGSLARRSAAQANRVLLRSEEHTSELQSRSDLV